MTGKGHGKKDRVKAHLILCGSSCEYFNATGPDDDLRTGPIEGAEAFWEAEAGVRAGDVAEAGAGAGTGAGLFLLLVWAHQGILVVDVVEANGVSVLAVELFLVPLSMSSS